MSARYAKQKIKWLFWRLDTTRPVAMGGIRGQCPPNFFCASPDFLVPRKICFKNLIKQNRSPLKCILPLQTSKPGYGPGYHFVFFLIAEN